jgi:hypothetical protein
MCNISGKANKLLGFPGRNLKVGNETTKENAIKAIVRSNLEYCSTVWSPHTKKNKDELERVQRRAARFVSGRYHNRHEKQPGFGDSRTKTYENQSHDVL